MIRSLVAIVALGLAAVACAPQGPQRPAIDPRLESGVSSSNGGGQRETGGVTGITLGPNGSAIGGPPNGRGNAY